MSTSVVPVFLCSCVGGTAVLDRLSSFPSAAAPGELSGGRLAKEPMSAAEAGRAVRDELRPDVDPQLNMATFITTWMEPEADALMAEYANRNTVDGVKPLRTTELSRRCIAALADLWHAPDADAAPGVATGGSSEACMLAGLAMLMQWRARHGTRGARPNLVMGTAVHVCWTKFCAYWGVEARKVPLEGDRFVIDPQAAADLCDENTIGVITVLGTTFDGAYEPVREVCEALDVREERDGIAVPVHVDAASGGMVAPFLEPQLLWDFRLPRVMSINTSGHKYGLVYPGLGWLVWRDAAAVPAALGFEVDYTGGAMASQTLTFTQPAAQIAVQYYQFLRLGQEGYREIMQHCRDLAGLLADGIDELDGLRAVTRGTQLPVVAFTTRDDAPFTVAEVTDQLSRRGWLVPAYTLPPNRTDLTVARLVIRRDFSPALARRLTADLADAVTALRGGRPGR
ncbi:glutamate decarboxylase [Streptomyces sp. NPDC056149]|uniref:glutamate decarboxylase n=1 Tax=Streptomyces sp. NPDC056149 TaxID=3345728 RepID=UPI0035DE2217